MVTVSIYAECTDSSKAIHYLFKRRFKLYRLIFCVVHLSIAKVGKKTREKVDILASELAR